MEYGRLIASAAALLCVAVDVAAKYPDCPDGQYHIDTVAPRARLDGGQRVELLLGTVALPAVCPPADAVTSPFALPGRWFGRVQARWDACDVASPIRGIRARFDPTCTTLKGVLRIERRRKARFHSTRVAQCGDAILQAPEECDAPGDPCCTADCRVVSGCSGPCHSDADCAAVAYCDWGGVCGATEGECRLRSTAFCGGAVCGCDGTMYSDYCAASAAGVPIEYFGPCGSRCRLGDERLTCGEGFFCDIPGWRCDQKEAAGTWGNCVAVPDDPATCVPYNNIPICGCDGIVYPNDCYRLAARVQWEACEP